MLAIAGGPVLSIRKDARSQLQLISLGVAHRLSDHHDDDDEDGEQDENAADCHRDHSTVTHGFDVYVSSGYRPGWRCPVERDGWKRVKRVEGAEN